jgi:methylenetetrahydrofolate reductase (NADPH)
VSVAEWLDGVRYEIVPVPDIDAAVAAELPSGSRVTVPHLPGYGLERTIDVAVALARRGFQPVPHIAARRVESERELLRQVGRLRDHGVSEVFVVGGDPDGAAGPYPEAASLLSALVDLPDPLTRIGVAGHPEGHRAAGLDRLVDALRVKQALGAAYVTTQMCYDAGALAGWIETIRGTGVTLPVVVGIPGAVPIAKLLRLGMRLGVGPSLRSLRAQRAGRLGRLMTGTFAPAEFLADLAAHDPAVVNAIVGLHVFTFNALRESAARLVAVASIGASCSDASGS